MMTEGSFYNTETYSLINLSPFCNIPTSLLTFIHTLVVQKPFLKVVPFNNIISSRYPNIKYIIRAFLASESSNF
jgi:hypothetical protein